MLFWEVLIQEIELWRNLNYKWRILQKRSTVWTLISLEQWPISPFRHFTALRYLTCVTVPPPHWRTDHFCDTLVKNGSEVTKSYCPSSHFLSIGSNFDQMKASKSKGNIKIFSLLISFNNNTHLKTTSWIDFEARPKFRLRCYCGASRWYQFQRIFLLLRMFVSSHTKCIII